MWFKKKIEFLENKSKKESVYNKTQQMENTQLRSAKGYNVNNMTFSKVQIQKIGDTGMTAKRINIGTKNDDGTEGELVFLTEKLFSFGVSENTDKASGKVNGYTVPLVLLGKDGATDGEQAFLDTFNAIIEKCKDYLVENKKELKMKDLERSDLRKLNPLYYKKTEDGEIDENSAPTLYAKLIVSKKNGQNKIITEFFDGKTGEAFNPLDLIGKYSHMKAVIKIESLFLGSLKTSLQVKLYEAEVHLVNSGVKKLLQRPTANTTVRSFVNTAVTNPLNAADSDVEDDVSSIKGKDEDDVDVEDDDEEVKVEKTIKELPVKKKKIITGGKKKKADE